MFCSKCGKEIPAGVTFCPACGQPQGATSAQGAGEIPSHLAGAILTTLFCCLPFGIVSIVYAARVSGYVAAGNFPAAQEASKNAGKWMWIAFWVGVAANALSVLFYSFVGLASVA